MTEIYLAAAAAAFTVDILIYPLDTLKTRQQSKHFAKTYGGGSLKAKAPLPLYRGLYQGVGSIVLVTLPASAVFFSIYEATKPILSSPGARGGYGMSQPIAQATASALAEAAACIAIAPAEVVKQNAQMLNRQSRSRGPSSLEVKRSSEASAATSAEAFRRLWAGPGVTRRLWAVYTALVARNLPFTALQFPIYEHVRERIWQQRETRHGEPGSRERCLWDVGMVTGASAGLAGGVAACATTPIDVVKTRMMLSAGEQPGVGEAMEEGKGELGRGRRGRRGGKGLMGVTKEVWRENGVNGLFRGGALRSIWTAVGAGLYLGTYEVAKVWLRNEDQPL